MVRCPREIRVPACLRQTLPLLPFLVCTVRNTPLTDVFGSVRVQRENSLGKFDTVLIDSLLLD